MAGRSVLIKSTTEAIPAYQMGCLSLPRRVHEELDRLNRDFLWGSSNERKKLYLINWEKVTTTKEEGGLGLFKMKERNEALLGSLNWRLHNETSKLWSQVIINKYGLNLHKRKQGSIILKGLRVGKPIFDHGARRIIRNGRSTRFWEDDWFGNGKLRQHVIRPFNKKEGWKLVSDYLPTGGWRREGLANYIPNCIWYSNLSIPPQLGIHGEDGLVWKPSSNGDFSTSTAYKIAHQNSTKDQCVSTNLSWIWKLPILPKQKNFVWLTWWNRLPTKDTLFRRNITLEENCPVCELEQETALHTLRDCPFAQITWSCFAIPQQLRQSFTYSAPEWLKANLNTIPAKTEKYLGIQWNILFTSIAWYLWIRRNNTTFGNPIAASNGNKTILGKAAEIQALLAKNERTCRAKKIDEIYTWSPSRDGFPTLNTDAATSGERTPTGLAGAIRDHKGGWIRGFSKKHTAVNSLMAEALALYEGLSLARNLGLDTLTIQTDAQMLIEYIVGERECNNLILPIIAKYRSLLDEFRKTTFDYIRREGNKVADKMARMSMQQEEDFVSFCYPPDFIIDLLHQDIP